jgi:hypothetical protein
MSVSAEKATLQVSFPKEKMEALKFYMNEKDTTIEKELQGYIKSVYDKYVPAATRRYLDRNDSEETAQAEVSISSQEAEPEQAPARTPSTRGRRRNTRAQTEETNQSAQRESVTNGEDSTQLSEDEAQGMTMNM